MLKTWVLMGTLAGTLLTTAAQATIAFQLDPQDGAISGSIIGWGFSLSNTENYLVVTSAAFEPVTGLGTFTDFISAPANFFVVGPALGGSTVWAQSFDATAQTGIGSFATYAGAAPGSSANGQIVLTYDLYSRSPFDPLFNPDMDTLSNGNVLMAIASVKVIPEASTCVLMLAGLGVLGFAARRQGGALRARTSPREATTL